MTIDIVCASRLFLNSMMNLCTQEWWWSERDLPKYCGSNTILQGTSQFHWHHDVWCNICALLQWNFGPFINLGEYPSDISTTAPTQQYNKLLICCKASKQVCDTYKADLQCLHNQLQEAINEHYIAELDDPHVDLTNIHPHIMYQNVVHWYVTVNLKMVEENLKTLNKPMDPTTLLGVYTKNKSNIMHLQQMMATQ